MYRHLLSFISCSGAGISTFHNINHLSILNLFVSSSSPSDDVSKKYGSPIVISNMLLIGTSSNYSQKWSSSAYALVSFPFGASFDDTINSGKSFLLLRLLHSTTSYLLSEFVIYSSFQRQRLESKFPICFLATSDFVLHRRTKSMLWIIMRYVLISGTLTRYVTYRLQLMFWSYDF